MWVGVGWGWSKIVKRRAGQEDFWATGPVGPFQRDYEVFGGGLRENFDREL